MNVYGPTEATICTSLCIRRCRRLGQAADRSTLFAVQYRVDPGDSPASDSAVTGELLIGGPCLARGYLNLPKLTADRFIAADGERWYRTGDLVRCEADGEHVFLGRIDRQIKVNGYRIEPEEIEAVLGRFGVLRSDALARAADATFDAKDPGGLRAAGRSALPAGPSRDPTRLARRLPEWMLPQRMVLLNEMPLTTLGKADTAALAAIRLSARPEAGPSAPPLRPLEQELLAVWQEVLKDTACGVHDDFFQTGGTSLALFEMLALAQTRGIAIPPTVAVRERTIAGIAAAVARGAGPRGADSKAARWLRLDIQPETLKLRQLIDRQFSFGSSFVAEQHRPLDRRDGISRLPRAGRTAPADRACGSLSRPRPRRRLGLPAASLLARQAEHIVDRSRVVAGLHPGGRCLAAEFRPTGTDMERVGGNRCWDLSLRCTGERACVL